MTKYKERDDALIAEAERLATKATQSTTKSLAWIEECQSALIHLVRSNWQPAPKPDRAEMLARDVLLAWSGYQQLTDEEARSEDFAKACRFTQTALAELRAEWEAEQDVVPRDVAESWKARADNLKEERENLLSDLAIMMSKHVENWPEPKRFSTAIALLDKTLTEALSKGESERPAVVVPDEIRAIAKHIKRAWPQSDATILADFILSLDGAKGGE